MSLQNASTANYEEDASQSTALKQSAWKRAWLNNQGAFLVVLASVTGSSMDAIVRFLQQGGHGMHPFQVWINEKLIWDFVKQNRLYLHE
jgi:hypothetical protein